MKSYFLAPVSSLPAARQALDAELSGQRNPWLLKSETGDPIAYFNVADEHEYGRENHVCADISGRHYDEDEAVLCVLKKVQERIGGVIKSSP
jgi:hypothetical protein